MGLFWDLLPTSSLCYWNNASYSGICNVSRDFSLCALQLKLGQLWEKKGWTIKQHRPCYIVALVTKQQRVLLLAQKLFSPVPFVSRLLVSLFAPTNRDSFPLFAEWDNLQKIRTPWKVIGEERQKYNIPRNGSRSMGFTSMALQKDKSGLTSSRIYIYIRIECHPSTKWY